MGDSEAMKEFKDGLAALRQISAGKALGHLKRAVQLDQENPFYLSYLGLALAKANRKWAEAEDLCYAALRMKRTHPELYLNLAEVYQGAGKKEDAVWVLQSGLQFTRRDARLARALRKLGVLRRKVRKTKPQDA